jgi:two-component system cell cycle sensor histidine kinase/response regulator CckA
MDLQPGSETILVVDDEEMVTDLARDILERFGYTVLVANSGHEAMEKYQSGSGTIAAVVLDMTMPMMDGREVFRRLNSIDPHVKVIISSGYRCDNDADDLLQQGASGYVQKPYRIAELVQKVGEVVKRKM